MPTTTIGTITHDAPSTPAVRWEPCTDFRSAGVDLDVDLDAGVCAGCGWSTDDHPVLVEDITALRAAA